LLLLTDDGPLIHSLLSPASKLPKIYLAQVEGTPGDQALAGLRNGVVIEGKKTLPAGAEPYPAAVALPPRSVPIRYCKSSPVSGQRLSQVDGRIRQGGKMTAADVHPTLRLIQHAIGPFTQEGLESGKWIKADAR